MSTADASITLTVFTVNRKSTQMYTFVVMHKNEVLKLDFYDKYLELCEARGIAPTRAALDMGFSKSAVMRWKNGYVPQYKTMQKIAEHFNISTDFLMGMGDDMPKVAPDVQELIEDYNSRPEMKMLFKATKGVTAEDIERAAKFLEAMKGDK